MNGQRQKEFPACLKEKSRDRQYSVTHRLVTEFCVCPPTILRSRVEVSVASLTVIARASIFIFLLLSICAASFSHIRAIEMPLFESFATQQVSLTVRKRESSAKKQEDASQYHWMQN
jgi:hypothetical protein